MSKVSQQAQAMSHFVMRSGAACTGAGTAMDVRLRVAGCCCSASASAIDPGLPREDSPISLCLL